MIYTLIIVLGFILDRIGKIYAKTYLINNPVQTKFINLTYLENRGAAFGILQNKRIFFIILTLVVVI